MELDNLSKLIYMLKEDKRRDILSFLIQSEDGATFKEISESTGIPPTGLAYHLKILDDHGFIIKEYRKLSGRRDYSFYGISDLGRKVLGISGLMFRNEMTEETDIIDQPDVVSVYSLRHGPRSISKIRS